jgi:uncharacterized protein with HEPN domain
MRSETARTTASLCDIVEYSELCLSFIGDMTYEIFLNDQKTICAVIRCLEVISEASRRLPEAVKARYPKIEWSQIAGAGNIYRHEYHNLNLRLIWHTAEKAVSELLVFAKAELSLHP